jgi:cell division protein ZapB
MQSELDALDQKLAQLVQLTQRLRAENLQLRQDVASALNGQRKGQDKIDQAAQRLEKILAKLPPKSQ